ncbi:hypothetical protein HYT55_01330 [Candidatus Woesearchaeota archaeon]|nr:hypothetical protein [Candidatus Woesearchaeota archaeon]
MFCAHCGTLLTPKITQYGKWMACPNGHTQPTLQQEAPTIRSTNDNEKARILVSDGLNPLAVHQHKCKYCSYDKAELIEIAPFYSDEDSIIKMKCGKCGRVEQLEGKVK